jgi:hypothetical protein
MKDEIRIAEERIVKMEERRKYFVEKYNETGLQLYRKLAESETEMISDTRNAIIEALLSK